MAFIVLEGLDGAGKSTQIEMLKDLLTAEGNECEFLHFPRFDSPVFGDMIARFLRGELGGVDEVNPYVVALLFASDRGDAGAQIQQWLDEGKSVILDRYVYSNIGYQCAKLDSAEKREELRQWILSTEFEYFGIPCPDLSLFLDVPLSFTEKKLAEQRDGDDRDYLKGQKDIHEQSMDLQSRVREVYLDCAKKDSSLQVVDCAEEERMAPPKVIFERICQQLKDHKVIK